MIEPDGVIFRFENAVSDKWRYSSDPDFGKLSSNQRKHVWTMESIQEEIEDADSLEELKEVFSEHQTLESGDYQ